MKIIALAGLLFLAVPAFAQESRFASDLRREGEHIAEDCDELTAKGLVACTVTLVTDYPFHLALGSLAPQNGFGFGLAFVERYTPNENWRINFSADAVRSTVGAWRSGGYATFTRTNVRLPTVATGAVPESAQGAIQQYLVLRAYVERTRLKEVFDFGPDFDNPRLRVFAEDQTIMGGSAVVPVNQDRLRAIALSIIGGVNGRFVNIDNAADDDAFVELVEDVRVKPTLLGDRLRLNYALRLQQFVGDDEQSFHRWTVDLRHQIPLYRTVASTGSNEFNGPNECFAGPSSTSCPPVTYSRNLGGTIGVRFLTVSSSPFNEGGGVPFYFQPTIGGSDINNQRLLAAYEDYRFRGPHVMAAQVSIEHSIWGPVGAYFTAERGKATQERSALNFSDLLASYSTGFSIRAGGAPVITASWAWGAPGGRLIVTMDAALLGGSSRPSLY